MRGGSATLKNVTWLEPQWTRLVLLTSDARSSQWSLPTVRWTRRLQILGLDVVLQVDNIRALGGDGVLWRAHARVLGV